MFYNNNKSLKQKAVCNGVFSESRPLAVKAAKLRIQLPPAESRKPMRAVSAALRLLRAEVFFFGITGGTVELIMLHPVFAGWSFFIL